MKDIASNRQLSRAQKINEISELLVTLELNIPNKWLIDLTNLPESALSVLEWYEIYNADNFWERLAEKYNFEILYHDYIDSIAWRVLE